MADEQASTPNMPSDHEMMNTPGAAELGQSVESRQWGMFCHLAAFAGILGVPFGHIVGPLLVWQIKKSEFPFVDQQGKEALNFQISTILFAVVTIPALVILMFLTINPLLFLAIWGVAGLIFLYNTIFTIIGAIKANAGLPYRYPLCIRFLK